MLFRLIAALIMIVSAIAFPWWLGLVLFFIFIFCFRNFYEAAIGAFLFDVLRHEAETVWPTMSVTAVVILTVYLIEIVKQRIVFYR